MIIHIALFCWKDAISNDEIEKSLEDVRSLKNKVGGLIDVKCGENFSKWNEGFTHAVVVLAKDRTSLDAYRKHPFHEDVARRIDKMEEKSIGIDFED
ncbi:Dabb family protein [archaeon]|nr:Dabb family protein [archaeon]